MAFLLPFLFLFFALALALRIDLYFTIVWFLLGLYALSRVWIQRATQHLQIDRRFADHAYHGDEVKVGLTVQNAGRLPIPWLEVTESVPVELRGTLFPAQVVSLGAHQQRRFSYSLRCRRRGYHALGPLRLRTGDVLGIAERVLTIEEPKRLTVYPQILPLHRLGLPTRSALVSLPAKMALFEDPSRIIGVRDYQSGDSPRRIHWTASARIGRLVVKQYQPAITRETLICLDLDFDDYLVRRHEPTEQAIVVAASLAHHMTLHEGLPVGLATEAHDPVLGGPRRISLAPHATGAAGQVGRQLTNVLEVLARVQPITGARFVELLRQESARLAWGSTMVVVTGRIDDDLASTMLYLKRSGHAVALILMQPDYLRSEQSTSAGELAGVPVHRVWTNRDLVTLR